MKIAVSGKGGVGKTVVTAALSLLAARQERNVLAIDADPDANLAGALGLDSEEAARIVPIAQQAALIEERTGAKVGQYGQIFKMNPEVADIADTHAVTQAGVSLLVLGAAARGGGGCACPENVLLRALVSDLVLHKDDAVFLDMEAGIEHLGRATARGVDTLLVVVEPSRNAVDCARRILHMAEEIGLARVRLVANKVSSPDDRTFIANALPDTELVACIPYADSVRRCDRNGDSVLDHLEPEPLAAFEQLQHALEPLAGNQERNAP